MSNKIGRQLPRYEVDRRLERASRLINAARWWLAGVLLLMVIPLFRVFVFCGASAMIFPVFAVTMSQPLEEMAQDVRNRMTKPLIIWMIIGGFLIVIAAAILLVTIYWMWEVLSGKTVDVDAATCGAANFVSLLLLVAVIWIECVFVSAWRGVQSLRLSGAPAFPITELKTTIAPTILPPRPRK